MSNEDFRKLLSQWANEDVYIGQLTWEEGDALADRLAKWHASQQPLAPDVAYWLCKNCGAHQYKDFDTCGDCNTPRR
jgi:hypothetical protein